MKKIVAVILAVSTILANSVVFADDSSKRFNDVESNDWAFEYITELSNRGVINGYDDGSFKPTKTVSRAEWAKMMVDAVGLPTADNNVYFADMADHWANKYVNAARDCLKGYSDGTFRPDQAISREEVTVAIIKIMGFDLSVVDSLNEWEEKDSFSDIDSMSDVSKACVELAAFSGLVSGYVDGTFRGNNSLSRSEATAFICRAFIYADEKLVSNVETQINEKVDRYVELTKDNIFDKNGKRIADFPCEYDYNELKEKFINEIKGMLPNKIINKEDIVINEGVFSKDVPVEHYVYRKDIEYYDLYGAKYLLAEMPISNEEVEEYEKSLYDETYNEDDVITPNIQVDRHIAYMYLFEPNVNSGSGIDGSLWFDVDLDGSEYERYWKEYKEIERERYLEYLPGMIRETKEKLRELNKQEMNSPERENTTDELLKYIIEYTTTDDMSDIEKVKAIHDWIIANIAYDTEKEKKMNNGEEVSGTDSETLINGKGVCAEFALLFDRFMKLLNIESIYIIGTAANFGEKFSVATNHAWNMVKIDGNWYHVDVTWDNPSKNVVTGNINYDYFLISDKQMNAKRQWNYGYYNSENHKFDNTPPTWYTIHGKMISEPIPECTEEIDVGFSRSSSSYQKPFR